MQRKILLSTLVLMCCGLWVFGQEENKDTLNLKTVTITANRVPFELKSNPGSVSIVTDQQLSIMPKAVAAEEALRLVPGVRIDNQHNGERIHLSIRGQGILTERGLRGIGVLLDGIPVNDPSGFAPDLYEVDFGTVSRIEVLRGPLAGLYGGSGSAGMINITTANGFEKPFGGMFSQTVGSNGFSKSLLQLGGTQKLMDYRVSYSRTDGDGYRDHQAFWGNKLYEKINFHPISKLSITQVISHIDYFHQNPEGLNLGQFDNLAQANPDACPFNEYQKTNRTTFGVNAKYIFSTRHDIQAYSFLRGWDYKETSNRCAEYRNVTNPGAGVQYNLHFGKDKLKNNFSVGSDFKWQTIGMYKLQSASNPDRVESLDQGNVETDSLMANQIISQQSMGAYALYKLEYGKFNFMASARYDDMQNELTNKMMVGDTAVTTKDFSKTTFRVGASYSVSDAATIFADYSQGFLPPSTEELASNPEGYSGFNTHLVPAESNSIEGGVRGFIGEKIYYEVTAFSMNTENDFFRFKQSGRGNQEVFYGNAGNSERKGIETYLSYKIMNNLSLQLAYTFADYKYTSATIDPVYTDTNYVLTTPPAEGQWLPNSPQHQLYAEVVYKINKNFKVSVSTEMQSKWAIYTDSLAYSGQLDPTIYQNWQDGFNLIHARLAYTWKYKGLNGECSVFARNITDQTYMAFTEPDPDGNSYQPGPGRELFLSLKVNF
ncbi:Vitamin B12 transporter BtuB [bioreactor metagenome]|uniref:Vitamin B12 transporter BtuB n=1 Tax=bioreactor metagenome TaxID=1076179 RepID=A0A644W2V9_9ZZZZ